MLDARARSKGQVTNQGFIYEAWLDWDQDRDIKVYLVRYLPRGELTPLYEHLWQATVKQPGWWDRLWGRSLVWKVGQAVSKAKREVDRWERREDAAWAAINAVYRHRKPEPWRDDPDAPNPELVQRR